MKSFELQIAPAVPSSSSLFDLRPVGIGPSFERSQRLVEGLTEVGQLVEGGRLDAAGVEVTYEKAVAFGPSEGVGEHLVRDAVQGVVEFLVAATTIHQFGEQGESPAAVDETNDALR